jgi:hypothetical protein
MFGFKSSNFVQSIKAKFIGAVSALAITSSAFGASNDAEVKKDHGIDLSVAQTQTVMMGLHAYNQTTPEKEMNISPGMADDKIGPWTRNAAENFAIEYGVPKDRSFDSVRDQIETMLASNPEFAANVEKGLEILGKSKGSSEKTAYGYADGITAMIDANEAALAAEAEVAVEAPVVDAPVAAVEVEAPVVAVETQPQPVQVDWSQFKINGEANPLLQNGNPWERYIDVNGPMFANPSAPVADTAAMAEAFEDAIAQIEAQRKAAAAQRFAEMKESAISTANSTMNIFERAQAAFESAAKTTLTVALNNMPKVQKDSNGDWFTYDGDAEEALMAREWEIAPSLLPPLGSIGESSALVGLLPLDDFLDGAEFPSDPTGDTYTADAGGEVALERSENEGASLPDLDESHTSSESARRIVKQYVSADASDGDFVVAIQNMHRRVEVQASENIYGENPGAFDMKNNLNRLGPEPRYNSYMDYLMTPPAAPAAIPVEENAAGYSAKGSIVESSARGSKAGLMLGRGAKGGPKSSGPDLGIDLNDPYTLGGGDKLNFISAEYGPIVDWTTGAAKSRAAIDLGMQGELGSDSKYTLLLGGAGIGEANGSPDDIGLDKMVFSLSPENDLGFSIFYDALNGAPSFTRNGYGGRGTIQAGARGDFELATGHPDDAVGFTINCRENEGNYFSEIAAKVSFGGIGIGPDYNVGSNLADGNYISADLTYTIGQECDNWTWSLLGGVGYTHYDGSIGSGSRTVTTQTPYIFGQTPFDPSNPPVMIGTHPVTGEGMFAVFDSVTSNFRIAAKDEMRAYLHYQGIHNSKFLGKDLETTFDAFAAYRQNAYGNPEYSGLAAGASVTPELSLNKNWKIHASLGAYHSGIVTDSNWLKASTGIKRLNDAENTSVGAGVKYYHNLDNKDKDEIILGLELRHEF